MTLKLTDRRDPISRPRFGATSNTPYNHVQSTTDEADRMMDSTRTSPSSWLGSSRYRRVLGSLGTLLLALVALSTGCTTLTGGAPLPITAPAPVATATQPAPNAQLGVSHAPGDIVFSDGSSISPVNQAPPRVEQASHDSDRYEARQFPDYTLPPPANAQPAPTTPPSYGAPGYGNPAPSYGAPGYGTPTYPAPGVPVSPDPLAPYPGTPPGLPGLDVYSDPSGLPPPMLPDAQTADLIINGYPARTGRIMLGGAVNSDAGVTGQITIDERNFDITRFPRSFQDLFSGTAFRGAGQTFRVEAVPGSQYDRYTIQFADPNLLGYLPISMSVSGFLFDRRFNDWDEGRAGGRLSFGYRVTPDLSIALGVSGQNVDIDRPRVLGVPQLDNVLGDNELYSGEAKLIHDTRDSPIQASQGHYFEFKFEEVFGDFDYARFEAEYRTYFLLAQRADGSGKQTLSYSTQLGFSGDDTPIFENFFAGGYATLRGFDFRGASPIVGGVEVGGRFQWLNSVEYMFPITADDAFRGVAFVDFGTVEQDVEINEDNFRVAPGMGLRVAIPMLGPAPLAFDFAYPIAMADTDDRRIFSFYMSMVR